MIVLSHFRFFVTFLLVQPLENKLSGNPWNTKRPCFLSASMLSRKRICTSIWAKHVAQQLIMLLERQQCMPVIAQFMLLKIDIPQIDKLAIFIRCCFFLAKILPCFFFSENIFLFSERFDFSQVQNFCYRTCERCKHQRKC